MTPSGPVDLAGLGGPWQGWSPMTGPGPSGTLGRHEGRDSLMHRQVVTGWTSNVLAAEEIDRPAKASSRTGSFRTPRTFVRRPNVTPSASRFLRPCRAKGARGFGNAARTARIIFPAGPVVSAQASSSDRTPAPFSLGASGMQSGPVVDRARRFGLVTTTTSSMPSCSDMASSQGRRHAARLRSFACKAG